jgi:hypothetical protein
LVVGAWNLVIIVVFLIFSLIREGFIDQHHRNIIFDLIDQAARFADQPISCPLQENFPFAFGAG